jgi:uncharacterized protein YegP (UPF0339 family)
MKKSPKLKFYKSGRNNRWRWTIKHGNHLILDSSSQGFTRRDSAVKNFVRTRTAMNLVSLSDLA